MQRVENLWLSRSWTTRPRRQGEPPDAYTFVDDATFEEKAAAGGFLEWNRVFDHAYGTPVPEPPSGRDVLLEIDVQGAFQIRFQYPDALLVFVLPPDEETLKRRLTERGRDSREDIEKRFRMAKREIHMAKGSRAFDHYVFNDDIDRAVEEVVLVINQKKQGGI